MHPYLFSEYTVRNRSFMQFVVSSSLLSKALSNAARAVPSNPVLDILEHFRFDVKDGLFTVQATDLDNRVKVTLPVQTHQPQELCVCVPSKILIEGLRSFSDQPLTFTFDEQASSLEVSHVSGKFIIPCITDVSMYPQIPDMPDTTSLTVPASVLSRGMARTVFASSQDLLRPSLNGVLFEFTPERLIFAATDGHRLSEFSHKGVAVDQPQKCIVPRKSVELIEKMSSHELHAQVTLTMNASYLSVQFTQTDNNGPQEVQIQWEVIARLLDVTFPNYTAIIPTDNKNELHVDRRQLVESLGRAITFSDRNTYMVKLTLSAENPHELSITTANRDYGHSSFEKLECEYKGEDLDIGFNSKSIMDILRVIDCDVVRILFGASRNPGLIKPVGAAEGEDFMALVMPVSL